MEERACKAFNATYNDLKLIYDNETKFVKEQLESEFSSFCKSQDRAILSLYEKQLYPVAKEIITIDLACLTKIDETSTNHYFKETKILEKIALGYGMDLKTVEDKFSILPPKAKRAIELFFNLKGDNLTIDEIMEELECDCDVLAKMISTNLRSLHIDFSKKIETKAKKSGFVLPERFYSYYNKEGYKNVDINIILNKYYSTEIKATLKKIYGELYTDVKKKAVKLTANDLENLKMVFLNPKTKLTALIDKEMKTIEINGYTGNIEDFNLCDYFISFGNTKEEFDEMLLNLASDEKQIISKILTKDFKLKLNLILSNKEKKIFNKIVDRFPNYCGVKIEEDNTMCIENGLIKDIVKYYELFGNSKEEIKRSLKYIPTTRKKEIKLLYDNTGKLLEDYECTDYEQKVMMYLIANQDGICSTIKSKHQANFEYKTDVTEYPYQYIYIYLGIRGIPPKFVDKGFKALTDEEKVQLDKYYTQKKFLRVNTESLTEDDKIAINKLMNKIAYNACNLDLIKEKDLNKKRFDISKILLKVGYSAKLVIELVDKLDEEKLNVLNKIRDGHTIYSNKARAAYANLILKCEFYTRIRNLKTFLEYLGLDEETFKRFIEMINVSSIDFHLFDYYDPQTYDLNEEFYYDFETLEEIRKQLDYNMLLYLYCLNEKVDSQTRIINTDNTYYELLTDIMKKVEKLRAENLLTLRNIPCIYTTSNKNYYILLASILSKYSFDGAMEIMLFSSLFNTAIKEYNENKARNHKKIYD